MSEIGGKSSDHYNNAWYQSTAALERGDVNGLKMEELYYREARLALQAAGALDDSFFKKDERILDVAVGTGKHSLAMLRELEYKVPIDGIDQANILIEEANNNLGKLREDVRAHLKFTVHDMATIAEMRDENKTYKLITVLGQSFIYQNDRERKATLKAMYDLLPEGGKLVLGWRSRIVEPTDINHETLNNARANLHIEKEERVIDGAKRELIKNTSTGDAFYEYGADAKHPDPDHPEEYEKKTNNNSETYYVHTKTGIQYFAFGRKYTDPDGIEHDLGVTNANNFLHVNNFPVIKEQLEEAGFKDVQLKKREMMGIQRNVAVVATK